ncbi:MAG: hypothetical protein WKF61_01645 [Luteimonas sp.]
MLVASVVLMTGCATSPAPDFKGGWQAVNRYAADTQEIPLHEPYQFHPVPMDGTLKTMLTRWARDSRMSVSYLHPSDFTLHAPIARIRTGDLQDAVTQLNAAYAGLGVVVTAQQNQIVVRPLAHMPPENAPPATGGP